MQAKANALQSQNSPHMPVNQRRNDTLQLAIRKNLYWVTSQHSEDTYDDLFALFPAP